MVRNYLVVSNRHNLQCLGGLVKNTKSISAVLPSLSLTSIASSNKINPRLLIWGHHKLKPCATSLFVPKDPNFGWIRVWVLGRVKPRWEIAHQRCDSLWVSWDDFDGGLDWFFGGGDFLPLLLVLARWCWWLWLGSGHLGPGVFCVWIHCYTEEREFEVSVFSY